MKSIEVIIELIQEVFDQSTPNGVLLGWNENRFMEPISRICSGTKLVNNTDFNYSNCNSFDIELDPSYDEHLCRITFKASFVADAYSLHVTRYAKDQRSGKVVPEDECEQLVLVIERLRKFADQKELREISCLEHDMVVAGVSLELSKVATIGKCLFDDFE